jgi:hypothetical protein
MLSDGSRGFGEMVEIPDKSLLSEPLDGAFV